MAEKRETKIKSKGRVAIDNPEEYWETLGPGLITGAADDDPSGVTTYSQAGARYGFQLLWLSVFSFPLMAVIQEMCARIGLVTGRGLAANIRQHYPRKVLYLCAGLLFAANAFNIGADLGAMAGAAQLLLPNAGFASLVVGFVILSLMLEIFTSYRQYTKYLKWLSLVLFAYVLSALLTELPGKTLLQNSIFPSLQFSRDQIILVTAVLGTTISPYLFFWQTSQEVEEKILEGKKTVRARRKVSLATVKKMKIDVWSGMFFSNLVMFSIIAASAATLHANGITDIQSAADAAAALRPLAGDAAFMLFALGIIGVGFLAIPILAGSASYAISESFHWKEGLYRKLREATGFYGVIIAAMLLGLLCNFIGLDPIKALIYSAVLNGLVAPVILVCIVQLSSRKDIMGEFANRPAVSAWGWIVTVLMGLSAGATVLSIVL